MNQALLQTNITGYPVRRGKVRDIYDLDKELVIISTDRISAFDWVLPTGVPDKGKVLTGLSGFWFRHLNQPHHCLSTIAAFIAGKMHRATVSAHELEGRSMLVKKARVVPIECVVRGYLDGSGWKEYQQTGSVCGIKLPPGLRQCDELSEPIFTPATKEQTGHDVNISFEKMCLIVGSETARTLRERSLEVYQQGAKYALEKADIIIADTKFEWGWHNEELTLIDEVLTPDSSRFWDAHTYEPEKSQPSFDKQFVRDWLTNASQWNKNSPLPPLPSEIISQTRTKYIKAFQMLTGEQFLWE